MNAMQKVAWTELLVSLAAVVAATAFYPWLGQGAGGAFGLLGLIGFSALFLRRRGNETVVDERDRAVEQRAMKWGIVAAWELLFMTLIVVVMWSEFHGQKAVSTALLSWLVWVQFAVCYGVKGLVGVLSYRSQNRAA